MSISTILGRRKLYLLALSLVALLLLVFRGLSRPKSRDDHLHKSDDLALNVKLFGPDYFDEALLINGPKFSQFETVEGKRRSIQLVKAVAASSFDYQPEPDEIIESDDKPIDYYLRPGLVPPEVHILWCQGGDDRAKKSPWFEYKNYLTVVSSLRSLHPDKVTIHMEKFPERDRVIYHQWLETLKTDFPWLYLVNMTSDQIKNFCLSESLHSKLKVIFNILDLDGGIFVGENTWMLHYPPISRAGDFDYAFSIDPDGTADGYIMMRAGIYGRFLQSNQTSLQFQQQELTEIFLKQYAYSGSHKRTNNQQPDLVQSLNENPLKAARAEGNSVSNEKTRLSSCFKIQQLYQNERLRNTSKCVIVKGGAFDRFYPMDIWQLNDPFGRLTRKLFYGSERVRLPVPRYNTLVPNIGHMIWIGGREMDFVFYLSVLSLLFVAKVDTVYIHGDIEPPGNLWYQLKTLQQTKDRVKFVIRTQPHLIYQEKVDRDYFSLMSDLIRVDVMIKYGGIYTDTDVIWVKPLSMAERGYDAVASYDWIDWSWPFQDTVNFGISYGKRDAPFWKIFRESMRKLYNDVHGFTGVMMPYKLLEKYPELLRIDRRLSVICYHSKCHPTYFPGYHDQRKDHTNTNNIPNWREDVHAFHWTFPNPPELFNRTTLLASSGIFAELGRNVLQKAGLL